MKRSLRLLDINLGWEKISLGQNCKESESLLCSQLNRPHRKLVTGYQILCNRLLRQFTRLNMCIVYLDSTFLNMHEYAKQRLGHRERLTLDF